MMVYEDTLVTAELPEDAATNGHVIVRPRRAVVRLSELPEEESAHLFLVASYAAAILFQGVQAEGTNIIINEDEERLTAHVVARRSDDGLDFRWEPLKLDEAAMKDVAERLHDKAFALGAQGKEAPKEPTAPEEKPEPSALDEAEAEENYLIQQLIRLP